jgi:endogenous inhibitor of DNA gyrase (YacG/DUF329 family)
MSEKIRISCPHCGATLKIASAHVGRTAPCPACQKPIAIRDPAAEPARPPDTPQQRPSTPQSSPQPRTQASSKVRRPPLASQPTHQEEFSQDARRILNAVSIAPDKYAVVEPYLMQYEQPVAVAVQRQFPFSIFADIVLVTTHRLMVFRRFFTKVSMFDVNYVDVHDVTIQQGFFTSSLSIVSADRRSCLVDRLITEQALHVYRVCQDIETKARIARRQFDLEDNRSRTTTMQINNVVPPPGTFVHPQQPPLLGNRGISEVGDEERDPYRLGE